MIIMQKALLSVRIHPWMRRMLVFWGMVLKYLRNEKGEANPTAAGIAQSALAIYGLYHLLKKVVPPFSLDGLLKYIPGANAAIDNELKKEVETTINDMFPLLPTLSEETNVLSIPDDGVDLSLLQSQLNLWQESDATANGSHFAYMYASDDTRVTDFAYSVFRQFQNENALNPTAFPALRRLEVSVTQMVASLFYGPLSTVGTMTSGGSESLICMLKAYRDYARKTWPHIKEPEVVAPITVHAAVGKGAHMLGLHVRYAPLQADYTVNLAAYERLLTHNTILCIVSAPQYPHGLLDPVAEVAEFCHKHRRRGVPIPLHVDACIGGFILPFVERLGHPVPKWDFRVSGVTSISADLHKFGYAPKGASVLLYRDDSYRRYQFWATCEWPGGLFVSPSILGTRSGGPIAAAWATLMATGISGYLAPTRKALAARQCVEHAVKAVEGVAVIGSPIASIVAWRSTDSRVNIFAVADALECRELVFADGTVHRNGKWSIEKQQQPDCIHMTCMPKHAALAPQLAADIAMAVRYAREHPELNHSGSAAMYGMVARVPSSGLVDRFLIEFESQVYAVDKAWRASADAGCKSPQDAVEPVAAGQADAAFDGMDIHAPILS